MTYRGGHMRYLTMAFTTGVLVAGSFGFLRPTTTSAADCFVPEGGTYANQIPGDGATGLKPTKTISFDYTPCAGKGRAEATVFIDGIEVPGPITFTTAYPSLFLHFDVGLAKPLRRGSHEVQVSIAEYTCDTCAPTSYNGSWSFVVGKPR